MDSRGLVPRDLVPFIGSRNRVYEVLACKRPLTLAMVRRLHEGLGSPAESLIPSGGPGVRDGARCGKIVWYQRIAFFRLSFICEILKERRHAGSRHVALGKAAPRGAPDKPRA